MLTDTAPVKGKPPRYEGVFVSRIEAHRNVSVRSRPDRKQKPHPAAKFVLRLYKGDIASVDYDGQTILIRVAGFSTSDNKIDAQSVFNSSSLGEWLEDTNPRIVPPGWKAKTSKNFLSINVMFASGNAKLIHISEDGVLVNR